MITYESLTGRIEKAKKEREKTEADSYMKGFWTGYIQCCRDIRSTSSGNK